MIMEENIVVIIETIFLHTGKSKTNDPHKIVLNLSKGLDLRSSNKLVAFQNLSIYYTWGHICLIFHLFPLVEEIFLQLEERDNME